LTPLGVVRMRNLRFPRQVGLSRPARDPPGESGNDLISPATRGVVGVSQGGLTMSLHTAKRPASAVVAGPYGHPFHPILVTVPIAAWVCSLVCAVSAHGVDKPGFLTQGSGWLIAIGVIGAVLAAAVGL